MVNQQKVVQQETAYSAVVVNVSPSLPISFLHSTINTIIIVYTISTSCSLSICLMHKQLQEYITKNHGDSVCE